jgi:glucose-1-phosphate adenylyltransferase
MELLDDHPSLDLYDREWVIHTRSEERAPARIGPTANVHRSLISHGCQIAGTVERSVLSPGVRVDPGAVVRDSVIMFDTVIRAGAVVDHAIIDKEVSIGPNAVVGMGANERPNELEPERLYAGITLIGKRAQIPANVRIGRNVRIDEDVRVADFRSARTVQTGATIHQRGARSEKAAAAQGKRRPATPATSSSGRAASASGQVASGSSLVASASGQVAGASGQVARGPGRAGNAVRAPAAGPSID